MGAEEQIVLIRLRPTVRTAAAIAAADPRALSNLVFVSLIGLALLIAPRAVWLPLT